MKKSKQYPNLSDPKKYESFIAMFKAKDYTVKPPRAIIVKATDSQINQLKQKYGG
jgi:hypothetical protein